MAENMFSGLTVLDFTNNYAGPIAGSMLADYGAEVIHIEKPVLGDDNRYFPPIINGTSINFCSANRGKKSITLDLKDPRAIDIVKKLAVKADVVIESFRPGVMDKLGLGYEMFKAINPRIIFASVSAYGQVGPKAKKPGYDVIAQAVSGMMEVTGEPDGQPTKIGPAIGDWLGALSMFTAVTAALYAREKSGKGQKIDISLVKILMWIAAKFDHHIPGVPMATRSGNHHTNLAPYGVFNGKNGQTAVIGILSVKLWKSFCNLIGKPELIDDERFSDNARRCDNKPALIELIEGWLKQFDDIKDAIKLLDEAGIPCAKIYNMQDIEEDEHYNAAGWIVDLPMLDDRVDFPARKFVGIPFDFSDIKPEYKPAAKLGANNFEIIEGLGYSHDEVAAMQKEWEDKVNNK